MAIIIGKDSTAREKCQIQSKHLADSVTNHNNIPQAKNPMNLVKNYLHYKFESKQQMQEANALQWHAVCVLLRF